MRASARAKALRALARALLPELLVEDPLRAVAITGSAARGDASPGSDLDLWCISPRSRAHHRVHGTFRGVDVTLLCDGPASSRAERSLLRCELGDLLVLRDPRGEFRAVQALARRRAAATWKTLCRNTSEDLSRELFEATRGPAWNRLSPLREAAIRYAAAWTYRRRGWRTPRWRTLKAALPRQATARLERILGIPSRARMQEALKLAARAAPLPPEVQARQRAGEWAEALLLARRHLERDVLAPPGRPRAKRWTRAPRKLVRALQALHGEADPAALRDEVRALAVQLKVAQYF